MTRNSHHYGKDYICGFNMNRGLAYFDSMTVEATTARARKFPENTHGFEFDGCKKQWNLGTLVSIVRMVKIRRIENIGGNLNP